MRQQLTHLARVLDTHDLGRSAEHHAAAEQQTQRRLGEPRPASEHTGSLEQRVRACLAQPVTHGVAGDVGDLRPPAIGQPDLAAHSDLRVADRALGVRNGLLCAQQNLDAMTLHHFASSRAALRRSASTRVRAIRYPISDSIMPSHITGSASSAFTKRSMALEQRELLALRFSPLRIAVVSVSPFELVRSAIKVRSCN